MKVPGLLFFINYVQITFVLIIQLTATEQYNHCMYVIKLNILPENDPGIFSAVTLKFKRKTGIPKEGQQIKNCTYDGEYSCEP